MKLLKIIALLLLTGSSINSYSQVSTPTAPKYYWSIKDFSKDIALHRAKYYVLTNILDKSDETIQFEIDPLAAATSGDLTSLVYRSTQQNKEGLLLGFFGSKWNEAGVAYQEYAFKNLPSKEAIKLLDLITTKVMQHSEYLNEAAGSNNISFSYEDMTFIVSLNVQANIRVFWDDYDASWDWTAFKRTNKRLLKKID